MAGDLLVFLRGEDLCYSLKQPEEAERLERAVESAIAKGARTADIAAAGMRTMSTRKMGDAVYAELATN
jgi:3-isopropylmalate dehydrogenase